MLVFLNLGTTVDPPQFGVSTRLPFVKKNYANIPKGKKYILKEDIRLVNINKLHYHEKVNRRRLKELEAKILKDGKLKKPVVVDKNTMLVLDGHHRCRIFVNLGIGKIPCQLVDYFDRNIKVNFRRQDIKNQLIKEIIITKAKKGYIFPYKTTKHLLIYRPIINFKLGDKL